ncbi:hypothetical protein D3C71_1917490 [compost metagenome]
MTSIVTVYMTNAAIAVKETSMPPDANTTRTPSANSPRTTEALRMSNRFDTCQKSVLIAPTTRQTSTISAKVTTGGCRSSQRQAEPSETLSLPSGVAPLNVVSVIAGSSQSSLLPGRDRAPLP